MISRNGTDVVNGGGAGRAWPRKRSSEYYRRLLSSDVQRQTLKLNAQFKIFTPLKAATRCPSEMTLDGLDLKNGDGRPVGNSPNTLPTTEQQSVQKGHAVAPAFAGRTPKSSASCSHMAKFMMLLLMMHVS